MGFPVFIKAGRRRISVAKEIREVSRLRLRHERSFEAAVFRIFVRVGNSAADEYTRSGSVSGSLVGIERDLEAIFRAQYSEIVDVFAQRVYDGRKAERFSQLIFQFYERNGAAKVTNISNTTRSLILNAIVAADKEGLGVDKTAKLIKERTSGAIGRARASTIARTETHAAASYATHEATKEMGIPNQRKRWVSVGDARTRSHHRAANGQEVGMDEPFIIRYLGQEIEMMHPHDGNGGAANNINCRCVAIYVVDEDAIFEDWDVEPVPQPVDTPEVVIAPPKPEKIANPFGVTHADELIYHNQANWVASERLSAAFKMLPAISKVVYKTKRAHYQPATRHIAMGEKVGDAVSAASATVWRHEYGHYMDDMFGKLGTYKAVGEYEKGTKGIFASSQIADNIAIDRAKYTKTAMLEAESRMKAQGWAAFSDATGIAVPDAISNKFWLHQIRTMPSSIEDQASGFLDQFFDGISRFSISNPAKSKSMFNAMFGKTGFTFDDLKAISGLDDTALIESLQGTNIYDLLSAASSMRAGFVDTRSSRIGFLGFISKYTQRHWPSASYRKTDEGLMMADFLEAMSDASVGWGHGKSYYRKWKIIDKFVRESHTTEVMANYISLTEGPNSASWRKIMELFAPETLKGMDELMEYYSRYEVTNEYAGL